ncbi:hypothetical protein [Rhodopirellula bahusiensis]|uniref:Uncharacterized protein n=1 Tax=Rhodopirellula bahusiensis TaxID=2014065 RepID=A0A2G1WBL9_9BACT|nr:hypothetical protein [Rhodopirellula bahusiensis]PHQ36438.1 hypothetical protein CEE69_03330 [Rhodopirellula bahusiensis]
MISPANMDLTQVTPFFADSDISHSLPLMNVTRMTDLAPQYQVVSEDSSIPMIVIVGVVLALTAIAGGVTWYYRTREPEVPTSDALTMDLCRAHGLSIYHRGLIDRLATAAELPHTAEMFLSPSHFDAAVAKAKQSVRLRRHHHGWLGEIRRMLFDA